ncbi:MAG: 5'/3'-nucleotidase SurE [Bacillota bacterium]
MKHPHILITNDDGIHAEGIHTLSQVIAEDHPDIRLSIIAPDRERSAIGHAITMHKPLRVEEINLPIKNELKGHSVNGTPSDCVKLAVEAILDTKPDLVISGINRGSNLGTDVLYSGTVSAAFEGLILGIPSVAVSLTNNGDWKAFRYAGRLISKMIPMLLKGSIETNTLVNVNVPVKIDQIKGVRVTSLGIRRYQNIFEKRTDPRGMHYYWMAGDLVDNDQESDKCDTRAVREGYISITPIHLQLTNTAAIPVMEKIIDQLKLI